MASEDDARNIETLAKGHSGEKGRIVLDVGSEDFFDVFRVEIVEQKVDAVGSVEGERDEIIFALELEKFEDFFAGVFDELIGLLAPRIFNTLAARIVLVIITPHGLDHGLGAQALTGGVEISYFIIEVIKVFHELIIAQTGEATKASRDNP